MKSIRITAWSAVSAALLAAAAPASAAEVAKVKAAEAREQLPVHLGSAEVNPGEKLPSSALLQRAVRVQAAPPASISSCRFGKHCSPSALT